MTRRAVVTQAAITRAIKATKRCGLAVVRVEVDGAKIVVLTSAEGEKPKIEPKKEFRL